MPKRIQRQRTKGWRMPEGVIYVGRPTKYGNPFWHVEKFHGRGLSLALYENSAQGLWIPSLLDGMPDGYVHQVYEAHRQWTARFQIHPLEQIRAELSGHDLSCWCRLCLIHKDGKPFNQPCADCAPCHVNILLKLANATAATAAP